MTDDARKLSLFDGLQLSGMTPGELWLSYYSVGGNASELEVEAYALGLLRPDAYQHNLIAQAINESFIDNGQDHPVSYHDQHAS
ncbi:MAG TPA: hypothetical protein VE864_07760 [Streptosporangiaceae bacterium]|nr:hypothetical protein [Streptosporangiaceae bacterium]